MDKPIPEGVLLPCPFCGGEPTPADDWLLVECLECAYSLDVPGYATIRGPKDAMVEHWNRREGRTLTAAQQPDHLVDANKMVAQQHTAIAPVAWLCTFGEVSGVTDDPKWRDMCARLGQQITPLVPAIARQAAAAQGDEAASA